MKNTHLILSLLASILFSVSLLACTNRHRARTYTKLEYWDSIQPIPSKPITIMIHGTGLFRRFIPILRQQATTPAGIRHLKDVSSFYHYARLARHLSKSDPKQFPAENFYLFGWSGALSFHERERAGAELYEFLAYLKNDTSLKNTPLTVLTVSHGGGVILNSARYAQEKGDLRCLVDRLIMLCCPIQQATQHYAHLPTFKKVIHCYSSSDFLQIVDPQGLYAHENGCKATCLFSERTFHTNADHIQQVELRSSRCKLGHLDFVLPGFHKKLPRIIDLIEDSELCATLCKNNHGICWIDINNV